MSRQPRKSCNSSYKNKHRYQSFIFIRKPSYLLIASYPCLLKFAKILGICDKRTAHIIHIKSISAIIKINYLVIAFITDYVVKMQVCMNKSIPVITSPIMIKLFFDIFGTFFKNTVIMTCDSFIIPPAPPYSIAIITKKVINIPAESFYFN